PLRDGHPLTLQYVAKSRHLYTRHVTLGGSRMRGDVVETAQGTVAIAKERIGACNRRQCRSSDLVVTDRPGRKPLVDDPGRISVQCVGHDIGKQRQLEPPALDV